MTNDSTRRSLRTGIDAIIATLGAGAAALLVPGLNDALGIDASELLRAGVVIGALIVFFTKVRNSLEDKGKIPALLKAPPSPGAHPIPDPEQGLSDAAAILLVAFCALVVLILAGVVR